MCVYCVFCNNSLHVLWNVSAYTTIYSSMSILYTNYWFDVFVYLSGQLQNWTFLHELLHKISDYFGFFSLFFCCSCLIWLGWSHFQSVHSKTIDSRLKLIWRRMKLIAMRRVVKNVSLSKIQIKSNQIHLRDFSIFSLNKNGVCDTK